MSNIYIVDILPHTTYRVAISSLLSLTSKRLQSTKVLGMYRAQIDIAYLQSVNLFLYKSSRM